MKRLVSSVFIAALLTLGAKGCTDCEKLQFQMELVCRSQGTASEECKRLVDEYKTKCTTDPCTGVICDPGFHCVNGTCIKDTPEDPCQGITCNTGYHCENGTCVKDTPPIDPCYGVTCDPGTHCELGNCVPDAPPPVQNPCPKELADGAIVYMNNKPYGNGFDSTVRVKGDPEFCRLIHGESINDCHLEGWPKRAECEYFLLGDNCPVWEYSVDQKVIYFCHDDHDAIASCDHYGNPVNRDDPQTRTTGDTLETLRGFEGEPKVCGLHRDEFGPNQGFFIIAHGKAYIRSCKPDRKPETCGPWKGFDH